jgi:Zn-dependent metalloprotease
MSGLNGLLIAVIGAVGGAVAAGIGGWLRSRRSTQSAARLVHAELQRTIAGDGDGELFNRFTIALEMIGHEVAIGLLQTDSRLNFTNQAGALKHGIANVLGALVKQYARSQTVEEADWLLGAGLLGPKVKGVALMSLAAPGTAYDDATLGKDPQPRHMRNFVRTSTDQGGVHVNSSIPSHAFYTTALQLGGYAWERAGRIWYDALHDPRLQATSGFRSFATATRSAAIELYGETSEEVAAVGAGWQKVGVSYTSREHA